MSLLSGVDNVKITTYRVTLSSSDLRFNLDGNTIVVSAIPEAETWAMLLAGLGLIGWRLRKQHREDHSLMFA